MTVTDRPDLGASTLNRMWYLDVNTGTLAAPVWTPVGGIAEFTPKLDDNLEDDSTFDSGGYQSQTKTAEQWSLAVKLARKTQSSDATAYDTGQEVLRTAGPGKFGAQATVNIRWYEMEDGGPREEAYSGTATVSWSPDGGSMTDLNTVTATLTGTGKRLDIDHPDTHTPTVTGLDPAIGDAAGGDLVTISGTGFTAASAVKFGATSATTYDVIDDRTIEVVSPAGSAGDVDVTVTNSTGTSATNDDTTFTYS